MGFRDDIDSISEYLKATSSFQTFSAFIDHVNWAHYPHSSTT